MDSSPSLPQRLGLLDATALLVGSMIGSGIFFAPAIMASWVESPGVLLSLWVFGGLFTIVGALAYAELGAMFPLAGGQYVFLREAFGRFPAFLYGWTLFAVIQTGFNAAVAIAFAKYLGVFIPYFGESKTLLVVPIVAVLPDAFANILPAFMHSVRISYAQLIACSAIGLLTVMNMRGIREAKWLQNVFTALKVGALGVLTTAGLAVAIDAPNNFQPLFTTAVGQRGAEVGFIAALAVAMSKALFAYDAWNTVTFVSEEVREPERNVPRTLILGTFIVTFLYVLANISFLAVIPSSLMPTIEESRVGEAVALKLFGAGGNIFVVTAIIVSTFGCLNGLILTGGRVFYAMAREGLFFHRCATINPVTHTPTTALLYQCCWSCVLAVTGSYDLLLTCTTAASVVFGALTVAAVYRLRRIQPNRPRPYRCWGYPVTPAVYLVIALGFVVYLIKGDPISALTGIGLMLSGVPYYLLRRRKVAESD